MFKFTNIVMYYAPIGVGAAMAYTVGHMGMSVLLPLGKLLLTAYAALAAFLLVVLLPIAFFARLPLARFLRAVAEPATIAFATSTSEAALPRAMECMEAFGVPRQIVAFVIPAGYSFNLDGSTLYLALASIFVAQAAGMHLTWPEQLLMVFTLMLTSKGVAGVPRAVLVVLLATAATFHLPTEPIFIILGIDALIDMARTAVNVIGNCLACAVVARWENQLKLIHPPPTHLSPTRLCSGRLLRRTPLPLATAGARQLSNHLAKEHLTTHARRHNQHLRPPKRNRNRRHLPSATRARPRRGSRQSRRRSPLGLPYPQQLQRNRAPAPANPGLRPLRRGRLRRLRRHRIQTRR